MRRDDDDGVGYIADSHLLRPSPIRQQEMALLKVPRTGSRSISVSSSVSDLEEPIYDNDNMTRNYDTVSALKKYIIQSVLDRTVFLIPQRGRGIGPTRTGAPLWQLKAT